MPMVPLRAPDGVSAVHGYSGALYMVGADGIVTVKPEDAAPALDRARLIERVTAEND